MIQTTTPIAASHAPGAPGKPAAPAAPGFALALASLLLPGGSPEGEGEGVAGDRQDLAGGGKSLPEAAEDTIDVSPLLAWFVPMPPPEPTAPKLTLRLPTTPQDETVSVEPGAPVKAGPEIETPKVELSDTADLTAPPPVRAIARNFTATLEAVRAEAPTALAEPIDGAALRRLAREAEPLPATGAAAPDAHRPTAVQATASAQQAPLDLSRQDWMGSMIDKIEAMRDAAPGSNDTRIRLAPDALGTVDVSLARDGDRIQVRFTAENATTRQLLSEAAPRLTELGEARGLHFGTSVDSGQSGQERPRHDFQPVRPDAPPRAEAAAETTTDQRIA